MTGARGARSLTWLIAATFLVTFVIGAVVQVLLAWRLLGPLQARDLRARAELAAAQLEARIEALAADPDADGLRRALAEVRAEADVPFAVFVFRDRDGRAIDLGGGPPGAARRGPPRADGAEPPHGPGPEPPRWAAPGEPAGPGRAALTDVLAHRVLRRAGRALGELTIYRLPPPRRGNPFAGPALLLALPVGLAASIVSGLVLARLLVRRLRALERHAARVSRGELSARIGDASGDEIGRLAEGLDAMTSNLAEARAQVEADAQRRRQLFADITHELATPLTSIRGCAETLVNPRIAAAPEARERYLAAILDEARRMERLLRDLFDLARLEAGATPLERERLDWTALCRNTAERFAPRFAAAGLALREAGAAPPCWIHADGHRLERLFENLLGNALRYVPSGGTVTWTLAADGARATLAVGDDGPGVPGADLPHIFERFYRSPSAPPGEDVGGSGLGLAIVREIARRHGGDATAAALLPHGLAIAVALPRGEAS